MVSETKKQIKALHLIKTSSANGAAWALRQTRELVKLGVEVHVAIPPGPMVPKYEAEGVKVHIHQFSFPLWRPWRIRKICQNFRILVEEINPDIIHSHFVETTIIMRLAIGKKNKIPRIFQVPGPLHLENLLTRNAEILTAGRLDYWIGSCKWTCNRYIKSGISKEHIFLAYYGVDVDRNIYQKTGKLRNELGIDKSVKLIGMVAYIYAPKFIIGQTRGLKGHEDLIDAIALCLKKEKNLICVMIGGPWGKAEYYEKKIKKYAKKCCGDKIIFLGSRNDVPELYPDFDVAVHPSHSENVGGAVESLVLRVPTITTNIGGFTDIVIQGETGMLVPPKSPRELAAAILETIKDPNKSKLMAEKGGKLATELLDVRLNARQVYDAYKTILYSKSKEKKKIKICRMTTIPMSLAILMDGQLEHMGGQGLDVTALSSPGEWLKLIENERGIKSIAVPMTRTVSIIPDFVSLWRLYKIFRREHFDIVHSHTPKAGLLGMIAAWLARVPIRMHTFAGTPTEDIRGLKWDIVRWTDHVTALFATECLTVSHSIQDILINRGVCSKGKLEVLLSGSSNGVDLDRFCLNSKTEIRGLELRKKLGIPEGSPVILFVGRVVGDKGVAELVEACRIIFKRHDDTHLVLVGPWEPELDPLPAETVRAIKNDPRIHSVGFQMDVEAYIAMSTLMAVPTYREGFPNVFIQAAAMKRPVVATRIPGVINAVNDGVNGILVPPRDVESLVTALERLLGDCELRRSMGEAGREFVEKYFDRRIIWAALENKYRNAINRVSKTSSSEKP